LLRHRSTSRRPGGRKRRAVGIVTTELTLDEIVRGRHVRHPPEPRPTRDSLDAGTVHEHLNGVVTDDEAVTERELACTRRAP